MRFSKAVEEAIQIDADGDADEEREMRLALELAINATIVDGGYWPTSEEDLTFHEAHALIRLACVEKSE